MTSTKTAGKVTPKTQMCVVEIDYIQLLLPATLGLQLLSLAQKAERVRMEFTPGSHMKYLREGPVRLSLEVLRVGQIDDQAQVLIDNGEQA